MFYPEDIVEEVRQASDIVAVISQYTALAQRGGRYVGLCPFHREKTPSFSVSPDKQVYHCSGCGASGNVVTFVMQKENLDFRETIIYLAERVHYTLPEPSKNKEHMLAAKLKNDLMEIHVKAARFYHELLMSPSGETARQYLDRRGLAEKTAVRFGLGYSGEERQGLYKYLSGEGYDNGVLSKSGLVIPDKNGGYYDRFRDRLMFPIFDAMGKVIGFGGRIMGQGEPKYLNSPETVIFSKSRNLYGLNFARKSKSREYILVEGYMDVIALHQQGFTNSVASLGTAFNADHASVLKKYCDKTILLFDSDEAGEKAAVRAITPLSASGLGVRVLRLSGAKDPDEYLKAYGRESFANELNGAENQILFRLSIIKKAYNLDEPAGRTKLPTEGAAFLSGLPNSIEREVYIKELSRLSGVSAGALSAEVEKQSDKTLSEIRDARSRERPAVFSADRNEKKNDEARRAVLSVIASERGIAMMIREALSAEEMVIEIYVKLYNLLYDRHEKNQPVYPAELVNNFEDAGDQKIVSLVFSDTLKVYDESKLGDALNGWIGIVKLAAIEAQMNKLMERQENDESFGKELNSLAETQRKLSLLVYNHHRWIK